jgi:hypothetical protein
MVALNFRHRFHTGRAPDFIAIFAAMDKDTPKALAIIIGALIVLGVLLVWANHIRPH